MKLDNKKLVELLREAARFVGSLDPVQIEIPERINQRPLTLTLEKFADQLEKQEEADRPTEGFFCNKCNTLTEIGQKCGCKRPKRIEPLNLYDDAKDTVGARRKVIMAVNALLRAHNERVENG